MPLTNFYFMLVNNLCKNGNKEKAFVKVNKSLVILKRNLLLRQTLVLKKFLFINYLKSKNKAISLYTYSNKYNVFIDYRKKFYDYKSFCYKRYILSFKNFNVFLLKRKKSDLKKKLFVSFLKFKKRRFFILSFFSFFFNLYIKLKKIYKFKYRSSFLFKIFFSGKDIQSVKINNVFLKNKNLNFFKNKRYFFIFLLNSFFFKKIKKKYFNLYLTKKNKFLFNKNLFFFYYRLNYFKKNFFFKINKFFKSYNRIFKGHKIVFNDIIRNKDIFIFNKKLSLFKKLKKKFFKFLVKINKKKNIFVILNLFEKKNKLSDFYFFKLDEMKIKNLKKINKKNKDKIKGISNKNFNYKNIVIKFINNNFFFLNFSLRKYLFLINKRKKISKVVNFYKLKKKYTKLRKKQDFSYLLKDRYKFFFDKSLQTVNENKIFLTCFFISPILCFNVFLSRLRINFNLKTIRFGGKVQYIPTMVNPLKDIRMTLKNFIKMINKNYQIFEEIVISIYYAFLNVFSGYSFLSKIKKNFYLNFSKNKIYMRFLIKKKAKKNSFIIRSRRRRRKRIKRT